MKRNILMALLGATIVMGSLSRVQAQDPWGLPDDVPTWKASESWSYARGFRISLDGTLADMGGGLEIWIDGGLTFTDTFSLQVDGIAPAQIVNTGFHGSQNVLAYVRNRTAGSLNLTTATARLTLALDGVEAPGEFVDIVLTLNPLNSSVGEAFTGVSDLSQIREQFETPLTAGTIQATTGSFDLCNLVASLSSNQLLCGGAPAPFQAALDLALLHAFERDNVTTGGLELLDFPTIDPTLDNGTGEEWSAFGYRGVEGDLTLIVPALTLNTVASVDFSTSVSVSAALLSKNVADPNSFSLDNRRVSAVVDGGSEEIYYSPNARELSYWQIANFSATTTDGLIVGLENFTTRLTAAPLPPVPPFVVISMTPARPLYGQAFTIAGTVAALAGNVTAEIIIPGGGGSTATVAIAPANTFSVVVNAPLRNDGTRSAISSTEREIGSFGVRLTSPALPPLDNAKVATIRLAEPSASRDWDSYE